MKPVPSHQVFKSLQERMLRVLRDEQKKRPDQNQAMVDVPLWYDSTKTERLPQWSLNEMHRMHEEVNRVRAEHGRPSIEFNDVRKVESSACGHSDYSTKFALYCAELTWMDAKEIQP